MKEKIAQFYKQPDDLNDIIKILHIIIDFLISSGCPKDNCKIIDYAVNVLEMPNIQEAKINKLV